MNARPSRAKVPAPPAPVIPAAVTRWRGGVRERLQDQLAEETPVAVLCNGEPHAVMLMSPADLEDFALGFALTEGLLTETRELVLVEQRALEDGIELDLIIPARIGAPPRESPRVMAGRSGCGLCGKRMVERGLERTQKIDAEYRRRRYQTAARASADIGAAAYRQFQFRGC